MGCQVTDIAELKEYLKIDKHRLDEELEEQPMLLFQISEAFVQAAAERDMLKEQLATIDANLDFDVRSDYGDKKYTEAMVKNEIQTDKKHDTAMLKYLDAKKQADLLAALKEAFQSRGYMLRDLASLYTANYYEQGSAKPTNNTNRATYSMGRQKRDRLRDDA
jgi:adenylate kinase family enzyme